MRERRRFSSTTLQPLDTGGGGVGVGATSFPVAPSSPVVVQIPYHFRCPISLELMTDPVTVSTGQTYDRSSIESWVQSGHVTCPVTRAPLSTDPFTLIPNHTLRRLIQEWCVAHRVDRIPTPKQPAEPSLLRHLLHQATAHLRVVAIRKLRQLARESDKNRALLSTFLLPRNPLLPLAFPSSSSSDDTTSTTAGLLELRNESLALVAMFPIDESDFASDPNRIHYLSGLLFDPDPDVRINAAAVVDSLLSATKSDDLRTSIASTDGIFEAIVALLSNPAAGPRGIRTAIRALFALCVAGKHQRKRAIAAGALGAVIGRLVRGELAERGEAERAAATVEMLVRLPEGCAEVADDPEAVSAMVTLLDSNGRKGGVSGGSRAAEHAAGALLALCTASDAATDAAVAAGVVTQLLLLVQSGCTDRAKRKAQRLLKLLRNSWPVDHIANSDNFLCPSQLDHHHHHHHA